jgi:hypothetical protein
MKIYDQMARSDLDLSSRKPAGVAADWIHKIIRTLDLLRRSRRGLGVWLHVVHVDGLAAGSDLLLAARMTNVKGEASRQHRKICGSKEEG